MKLFFDTETTGKANYKLDVFHPSQPRLVQLAVLLTEDIGQIVHAVKLLVRPDGFEIPAEATAIHGITTEYATQYGMSVDIAVNLFRDMVDHAQSVHAFNLEYDELVMENEYCRSKGARGLFESIDSECEMLAMKPICRLPGYYGDFKWLELREAYRHAFGRELVKTHEAFADVRATADIHFWRISGARPQRDIVQAPGS